MPLNDVNDAVHESLVRVARRTLVVVAIVALALLVWRIRVALLLGFIGILLAVLFRGEATLVKRYTRIPVGWALLLVAAVSVGLVVAFFWLAGPAINEQFSQLLKTLPASVARIRETINRYSVGKYLLSYLQPPAPGSAGPAVSLFSGVTGIASTLYGVLTDLLLVLVSAIYFAVNPQMYMRGILLLIPKSKSLRVAEVLEESGRILGYWLIGQVLVMVFVGVMVTLGLSLIGIPLALVLGVISGMLEFIPIFGPVVAAVPGILIAMTGGWVQALYAALVYLIVQEIESNVLVPLVQKVTVEVPPALVVLALVAFGYLFGFLGILIATPMTALIILWVKRLYIEDALRKVPPGTGPG
jgi:predicted PurR-regulated permease PerM